MTEITVQTDPEVKRNCNSAHYLQTGDIVEISLSRVGALRNTVIEDVAQETEVASRPQDTRSHSQKRQRFLHSAGRAAHSTQ